MLCVSALINLCAFNVVPFPPSTFIHHQQCISCAHSYIFLGGTVPICSVIYIDINTVEPLIRDHPDKKKKKLADERPP